MADVVVEVWHFPRPVASVRDEGLPSLGALDLYVLPVQAEAGFDAVALERGCRTVSDARANPKRTPKALSVLTHTHTLSLSLARVSHLKQTTRQRALLVLEELESPDLLGLVGGEAAQEEPELLPALPALRTPARPVEGQPQHRARALRENAGVFRNGSQRLFVESASGSLSIK